jgi:hypothetical protein
MPDPALKISIAIMGCQLMRRLSGNYPTKDIDNRQKLSFSVVIIRRFTGGVARKNERRGESSIEIFLPEIDMRFFPGKRSEFYVSHFPRNTNTGL